MQTSGGECALFAGSALEPRLRWAIVVKYLVSGAACASKLDMQCSCTDWAQLYLEAEFKVCVRRVIFSACK
eukprot:12755635-Alexandrium_andersonii.AAC.1